MLLVSRGALQVRRVRLDLAVSDDNELPRQGGHASTGSVKSLYHLIRLVLVISLHRVRLPIDQRSQ